MATKKECAKRFSKAAKGHKSKSPAFKKAARAFQKCVGHKGGKKATRKAAPKKAAKKTHKFPAACVARRKEWRKQGDDASTAMIKFWNCVEQKKAETASKRAASLAKARAARAETARIRALRADEDTAPRHEGMGRARRRRRAR